MVYIRINQCPNGEWYHKHIGKVMVAERIELLRHCSQGLPESVYWCREGGVYNPINYVRFSDATCLFLARSNPIS